MGGMPRKARLDAPGALHHKRCVRDTIGADWKSFTQQEVRLFERLLGMGWTHMEKAKWEKIPFASMTKEDVKRILAIARCIDIEKASQQTVVEKVEKALLKVG